jgi:quercetin dioxygenase-like cupin family protein
MSAPARIITNPVTGERLTWLLTSEQTGGRLVRAEVRVHGAGRGARTPHAHPDAEARFTVVSGRLALEQDGAVSMLGPGETVAVAPGVWYAWWNARAGELCLHVEISPPGRFEELTELGFRWARETFGEHAAPGQNCPKVKKSLYREHCAAWRSWNSCRRSRTGWARSASR